MKEGAPVRFLLLLLAGWTCLRVATLSTDWWEAGAGHEAFSRFAATPEPQVGGRAASGALRAPSNDGIPASAQAAMERSISRLRLQRRRPGVLDASGATGSPMPVPLAGPERAAALLSLPPAAAPTPMPGLPAAAFLAQTASQRSFGRWSGSAWLLARRDGGVTLAPGGTLGGSQAGARLLYRVGEDSARPLSLSARLYAPLHRPAGAEAALGLDWRPVARLPAHLLVERRERLGRDGRSAFAITLYGGGSAELGRGWRLDSYARAGVVGARSRHAFADGAARLSRTVGPVEAGGALWGAAQPGTSRVDVGPQLTLPLRTGAVSLRLSAEYRVRVAGEAQPSSGPAFTLGVDF